MKPDRPWYWNFSIAVLLVSMSISGYTVHAAVVSVQKLHPAENYANLSLNLLGIPGFLFQATIMLILIVWCVRKVKNLDPTLRVAWLLLLAILLPAITLAAIVVGNYLTKRNHPYFYTWVATCGLILGTGGL